MTLEPEYYIIYYFNVFYLTSLLSITIFLCSVYAWTENVGLHILNTLNYNGSDVSVWWWPTLTWRSGWNRRRLQRAEESNPRCPLCWRHSRSPPETAPSQHFHQCRPARGHTATWWTAIQVFIVCRLLHESPLRTLTKWNQRANVSQSPVWVQ